jgi:CRISPR/Cas system-associated exonuclease Cas4 (RecB family)
MAGVIGYLATMKANQLSGNWNCAEKKYVAYLKEVPIAARVDLIFHRESLEKPIPGVTILDGKNSKTKGKYTDPDQLRFYALVYYLTSGKLPDRVGFVYYRYPYGTPKEDGGIESGVDWVPLENSAIQSLAQRILNARAGITAGKFEANPTPARCKFCDFEEVCSQRQVQKKANSGKRKPKDDILPPFTPDAEGFEEL